MNDTKYGSEDLTQYQVQARNTSAESENKIHDDEVAARFGFRGGLVPGVTVYGYMTVPLVERFGLDWLARGSMNVRFHKPFYEGEEVVVKGKTDEDSKGVNVSLRAERADGEVCATATAEIGDRYFQDQQTGELRIENYPEVSLPSIEDRPPATKEAFAPGIILGTLIEQLKLPDKVFLAEIGERLPVYYEGEAVAHPAFLLGLMNQVLVRNFKLGPWIHAESKLINHSVARDGETISIRSRVRECFERKGHEFVVVDMLALAGARRVVQQVRHTAIYRPRFV